MPVVLDYITPTSYRVVSYPRAFLWPRLEATLEGLFCISVSLLFFETAPAESAPVIVDVSDIHSDIVSGEERLVRYSLARLPDSVWTASSFEER